MTKQELIIESIKYILPKIKENPHPKQWEILENLKRYTIICAGTRFGKSYLCALIALAYLMIPGQRIWIVAPTYDLSKKTYSYLSRWLASGYRNDAKKGIIKMTDRMGATKIINKKTGSWIEFKSSDSPTGLLGEELDLCILDEASRAKEDVWTGYLYSRLTSRKGNAIFISTPFGKNWFYKEWLKGKDPERPEYASFHFTSKDNPYFSEKEWLLAKENLPTDSFNQEHQASFLDSAAMFFRNIDKAIRGELKNYQPGHFYIMGLDLAKYKDFTVATVIDRSNHQVVGFDRFHKIDWPLQKERIYAMAKSYGGARIVVDSTGVGDPIADDLRRMGLAVDDFKYTNTSKEQLLEKLSLYIEQGRVFYPPIDVLIGELESFGYERTEGGRYKYGAPAGMYDDCVNSLALAVWTLPQQPVSGGDSNPILVNSNIY